MEISLSVRLFWLETCYRFVHPPDFVDKTPKRRRIVQYRLLAEGGSIHIAKQYKVSAPPGVGTIGPLVDFLKVTQLAKPRLQLKSRNEATKPQSSIPENASDLRVHINFPIKEAPNEYFGKNEKIAEASFQQLPPSETVPDPSQDI